MKRRIIINTFNQIGTLSEIEKPFKQQISSVLMLAHLSMDDELLFFNIFISVILNDFESVHCIRLEVSYNHKCSNSSI